MIFLLFQDHYESHLWDSFFYAVLHWGPVNGTIAGKRRDWKLGSLVPIPIVLDSHFSRTHCYFYSSHFSFVNLKSKFMIVALKAETPNQR